MPEARQIFGFLFVQKKRPFEHNEKNPTINARSVDEQKDRGRADFEQRFRQSSREPKDWRKSSSVRNPSPSSP
jgi:hypothetical protein